MAKSRARKTLPYNLIRNVLKRLQTVGTQLADLLILLVEKSQEVLFGLVSLTFVHAEVAIFE